MKKSTLLSVDNINKIVATTEKPTNYVFYPAEPAKQKYVCKWLGSIFPFSPIPFGKTQELPDRWVKTPSYYDDDYYLRSVSRFKINDDEKIVTEKAKAIIQHLRGENTILFFNSDQELRYFIDDVNRLSKKELITIITND